MPAPRELSQQIPAPRAKARMQKPQGGGNILVQIPGGARGGYGYGWNWYLHFAGCLQCHQDWLWIYAESTSEIPQNETSLRP